MSLFNRLLRSVLCLGSLPFLAAADSGLTLDEALRRAAARHPDLIAQDHAARAADALVEQAGLRPNPTLDVSLENFAGTGAQRGLDGFETTVQASQRIERGGKREHRLGLAGGEHAATTATRALRQTEVLAATAAAYIELLAAREQRALAAAPLRLARETANAVAARVQAADASPAESARARVALVLAQAAHARAESALANARATLAAQWAGDPADVPADIAGTLRLPAEPPAQTALLAQLATHPRLDLQHALITTRRAALQLERAQAVPDVTVAGGVRFFRDNSDAALVAGISVPLTFRNQNQGNIRAARENLAGAEQTTRSVELALRVAFTAAWQDFTAAHAAATTLRRDALPATEEAQTIVRQAYDRGELPLLDVLDAQRAHASLRREILDAETAAALALVRLDALTDPTFPLTTRLLSDQ